jgi:site-specific DNA-adenine methylase
MMKNAIKNELIDALINVFKNAINERLIDALICILKISTDDELINAINDELIDAFDVIEARDMIER